MIFCIKNHLHIFCSVSGMMASNTFKHPINEMMVFFNFFQQIIHHFQLVEAKAFNAETKYSYAEEKSHRSLTKAQKYICTKRTHPSCLLMEARGEDMDSSYQCAYVKDFIDACSAAPIGLCSADIPARWGGKLIIRKSYLSYKSIASYISRNFTDSAHPESQHQNPHPYTISANSASNILAGKPSICVM